MHRFTSAIRRPVKRQGSEQYLLVMLLSFAGSVTFTRLFLAVTGYPQLGGGQVHIAHVLWGGLLLFAASILPLVISNRWVFLVGSFLSGTGVGLFIDEVGKFITQTNDYFYPLAAPIIYAFFLLTVLFYLRVRKPSHRGPRAELYRALDAFEEVLEHDLDPDEKIELEERLQRVAGQNYQPELARLANDLLTYLSNPAFTLAPPNTTLYERLAGWWTAFETRWVTRNRLRAALSGGLLAIGIWTLINVGRVMPGLSGPATLERLLTRLYEAGLVLGRAGLYSFLIRIALEVSVGLLQLSAAGLMIAGKDRPATTLGYASQVLALTTVDLLVFYFDQFSAIVTAVIQFALLLGIGYYRQKYVRERPAENPLPSQPAAQEEPIQDGS